MFCSLRAFGQVLSGTQLLGSKSYTSFSGRASSALEEHRPLEQNLPLPRWTLHRPQDGPHLSKSPLPTCVESGYSQAFRVSVHELSGTQLLGSKSYTSFSGCASSALEEHRPLEQNLPLPRWMLHRPQDGPHLSKS